MDKQVVYNAPQESAFDTAMRIGRLCWEQGLVSFAAGNLSFKAFLPSIGAEGLFITASGSSLANLTAGDFIQVEGAPNPEGKKPSTELPFHLRCYERPAVKAVLHTHSPNTISHAHRSFNDHGTRYLKQMDHEGKVINPSVPIVTISNFENFIPPIDAGAVVVANHGVFVWGADLYSVFARMSSLEHSARIFALTRF